MNRPAREEQPRIGVAQYAGFSLHAGVGVQAEQRDCSNGLLVM
jgi:hypothetical protein